jgi:hypothetical protein
MSNEIINLNINSGLGDLLLTRTILINFKNNNLNNYSINLYISKYLNIKYRSNFYGLSEDKYFENIKILCEFIFKDIQCNICFNDHTGFSPNNILLYLKNISYPIRFNKYIINYSLDLPNKYITINCKSYGVYKKNWDNIYKDKFFNLLNNYNLKIILIGDNKYINNEEYIIHNTLDIDGINIHVIYSDLIKLNNNIDMTFKNSSDIIDLEYFKRNIYILNNSLLNISFSVGGTNIFNYICGNTLCFSDKNDEWINNKYINESVIYNKFNNFDDFCIYINNFLCNI